MAQNKIPVTVVTEPQDAGTIKGAGAYFPGKVVELYATPAAHYIFVRWEGPVSNPTSTFTRTYAGQEPVRIIAKFELERIQIKANVEPAGAGTVEGEGRQPYGTKPHLRAVAASGFIFVGWEGPVAGSNKVETTLSQPLTAPVVLTAKFERYREPRTLSVTSENSFAGKVTGGGSYPHGTKVKIKAEPISGYEFNGWSGPVLNPGSSETEVVLTADMQVSATFIPKQILVRASISPSGGGKVTGDIGPRPPGIPCSIKAEPAPGFMFVGWDGPVADSKKPSTTVTPTDKGRCVVTARFQSIN